MFKLQREAVPHPWQGGRVYEGRVHSGESGERPQELLRAREGTPTGVAKGWGQVPAGVAGVSGG